CGSPITITVTVIPRATPTFPFGTTLTICGSGSVPVLPNTSTNGFTGTWSPSVVDNQNSGTYTFTPNAGQCANPTTFTVTVNPNITPTFAFGTTSTQCAGTAVPVLPGTSSNGIAGTWSPATVDNQNSGTYTFTPNAGLCATNTTYTVTINPNIIPTFSFGNSLTICAGGSVPVLPTTSTNGITGTWTPSVVSNQNSATYTFNYSAGQCATPFTFTVTVNPNIVPTFAFGTTVTICSGGAVPTLPTTSTNGILGTWNPATVDNLNSGTYTFTPKTGLCATTTTLTVTINPNITPTFSFGTTSTQCAGTAVPNLPGTSTNGITGTWNPATVDNQNSGTYTFTPTAGLCATTTTYTVTINPNLTATFSFGSSGSICAGGVAPILPTTSANGLTGTWSPSVVSNQVSGTYVFTGTSAPCIAPFTFTFTVNPIITPAFSFGTNQSVCIGAAAPVLPGTSTNGINGTWSPSVVDNMTSGTYTFTPSAGQCASTTTLTYQVNPIIPSVTVRTDTTVYDGDILPAFNFISTPGSGVNWTNSNATIGLGAMGTGPVPSFTAINMTNAPAIATIIATPFINGCSGTAQTYAITVLPLNKDIFVPNVFSPNNDGKNDLLHVYSNYINKVEMHIFNQWGQKIASILNSSQGWDGTYKGKAQPVGVYVYVLNAVLTNGKKVNMKGSITLVR
ncbi:MAG TPA: gliding motility-associated C-terminal domain-containing protein, partial [Flavitalea sp.]|nr:gliding motility-associated C-terminal domain-containing protein [Flavitalea sp.]